MADNTTLNSGSGGDTLATDDIGSYKIAVSKIHLGADGVDGGAVATGNPFPVSLQSAAIDVMLGTDFSAVFGAAGIVATAAAAELATGIQAIGSDGTNARVLATETDGALHIHDGGNSITVDAAALPLPTGAATAAYQSTGNTSLSGIDTNTTDLPNVIGDDGASGPSKALSIGGTESGGNLQEVRVDGDGHLQVDVLSGGGSGTEYTEDAVAPADPEGPAQALRYRSSPTSEAGTAGDWVIRSANQYGAAFCQLVTSAGAFIDSVGGGTEFQVDAAAGGTDLGKLVLAVRNDTLTTLTPVDGDYTQLRTNNRGAQWVAHDGVLSVDWNGTAPPIGAGTEAAALRVTVATDSTGVLTVDDGGGSLTVDNASITTLAGAVSGSEMQVDVVGALPAGSNNIGDVDVATQPARAKTTDNVGVAQDSEVLMDGTSANSVKFANIDTASSGDNAVVAAVTSKKIKVVSVALFASGSVDVYLNDGTADLLGGTRKIKLDNTGAGGAAGFVLGHNPQGWLQTAAVNRPLNLNLSAAVGVAGTVQYVEVD